LEIYHCLLIIYLGKSLKHITIEIRERICKPFNEPMNFYKYGLSAGILEQAVGARNQVGIVLSYRPARARICRSFKETRYRFSAWRAGTKPYLSYWPARLHRLAIPGLHKRLQIRAQAT
jgi:hypothetical protein